MRTGTILCLALAALPALAQPAPEWLRDADMVNSWDRESNTVDGTALAGIPLLINVPGAAGIAETHAQGFKGIPYTSSMDAFVDERGTEGNGGRYPFRPDTSNALLVDKDGRFMDTLMDGTYRLSRKLICVNNPTFERVMMGFLKSQMDAGMDGLFIDNVSEKREECFGDGLRIGWSSRYHTVLAESRNAKFKDPRLADVPVHKHLYPGQPHSYAFREWLLKVRKMVKTYGPDKVTVINGGLVFAPCADGTMIESYVCSWAWQGRRQSWQQLKAVAGQYAPYIASGGAVIALSYLGTTPATLKDDAFFCFAAARLSGFVWSDYRTAAGTPAAALYRVHLGPPAAPLASSTPGVDYRWFRGGLAVVNGTGAAAELSVTLPPGRALAALDDVYLGVPVAAASGQVRISVPAQSGRVYVAR
jgi:hypothetical protein